MAGGDIERAHHEHPHHGERPGGGGDAPQQSADPSVAQQVPGEARVLPREAIVLTARAPHGLHHGERMNLIREIRRQVAALAPGAAGGAADAPALAQRQGGAGQQDAERDRCHQRIQPGEDREAGEDRGPRDDASRDASADPGADRREVAHEAQQNASRAAVDHLAVRGVLELLVHPQAEALHVAIADGLGDRELRHPNPRGEERRSRQAARDPREPAQIHADGAVRVVRVPHQVVHAGAHQHGRHHDRRSLHQADRGDQEDRPPPDAHGGVRGDDAGEAQRLAPLALLRGAVIQFELGLVVALVVDNRVHLDVVGEATVRPLGAHRARSDTAPPSAGIE